MWPNTACRNARQLIYEEGLGRLAPGQHKLLEEHLGRCASCRGEAEGYRAAARALTAYRAETESMSAGDWCALRERLIAQSTHNSPSPRRAGVWRIPAAFAAAAAAVAMLAILMSGRDRPAISPSHRQVIAQAPETARNTHSGNLTAQPEKNVSRRVAPSVKSAPGTAGPQAAPRREYRARVKRPTVQREPAPRRLRGPRVQYAGYRRHTPANKSVHPDRVPAITRMMASANAPKIPMKALVAGSSIPPSDPMPARRYVIGSIPTAGSNMALVSNNEPLEERLAW